MPYYRGDYYRGDYYRGDILGIGGFLKKVVGGVAKVAGVVAPGPIGAVARTISTALAPKQTTAISSTMNAGNFPMMAPEPGIAGTVHRIVPGGSTGYGRYKKDGEWTDRRRPRMQVTNTRALKRAGRRIKGFLKVAASLGALPVNRGKGGKLFKRKKR